MATINIDRTTADTVTVTGTTPGARTVTLSWADLIAAARQPEAATGEAYAAALARAISKEAERVGKVPVRVVGRVVDEAGNGCACVAYVDLLADGYSLDSHIPATRRARDEGGTHVRSRLAENELADRLARIAAVEPKIEGRTAAQVSTWDQIRHAVAGRHGLVNVVGKIEIR